MSHMCCVVVLVLGILMFILRVILCDGMFSAMDLYESLSLYGSLRISKISKISTNLYEFTNLYESL